MKYKIPTYNSLNAIFKEFDIAYHKIRTSKSVRGKRQRAMLKGNYTLYHDIDCGECKITYVMLIHSNLWYVILYSKKCGGEFIIRLINTETKKPTYIIIRNHAVERYIQRQIFHNESHEMTDEEYITYSRLITTHFVASCFNYDKTTNACLCNYDGGSFIALPFNCEHADIMLVQTYITVSMMKPNQSIVNAQSKQETKHVAENLKSPMLQRLAQGNLNQ